MAELGGLPLALEQAAFYMEATGNDFSGYLKAYREQRVALLDKHDNNNPHELSVTATFLLSFEKVKQESPAAAELLTYCAFLAADGIPEEIFTTSLAIEALQLKQLSWLGRRWYYFKRFFLIRKQGFQFNLQLQRETAHIYFSLLQLEHF